MPRVIERIVYDTGTSNPSWIRTADILDEPCRAITSSSGGSYFSIYERELREGETLMQQAIASDKPPFRLPSMADVARARGTTGLTVASTFAGCGGSCLGFEMAGYDVLWANEFLPIAQASHRRNHPKTLLDGRDIRQIQASEILGAIGMKPGELDVFNGSPPCQAFSSSGQRAAGWGKERHYANGVSQRNEDLFFEYVRLLEGLKPRAFVAENVSGLVRGVAIGYFKEIMRGLSAAGYRVRCRLLDAQWLGVPQTRSRAIFIGVREDLDRDPPFPKPLGYRYSLREALPGIAGAGHHGIGSWRPKAERSAFHAPIDFKSADEACPTITSQGAADFRVIEGVINRGAGWRKRPAFHGGANRQSLDEPSAAITSAAPGDFKVIEREAWLTPGSKAAEEWKGMRPGGKGRYFNLVRPSADAPSPAILSGAEHGTAAVTLPNEPRRFTIDECKRICSFPADFVLEGSYAEQWARLGNAVPPLMMRAIAAALRDGLFTPLGRTRGGFSEAI